MTFTEMKAIQVYGNTYRTEDYSIFKRLDGNRAVLARRVSRISKSISENGYIYNPIVVNEHFEIIDGQGRFEALKLSGLPVDFVVAEGEMYVAMYEENETIDFRGWIAPCCASTLRDVTHWTDLPRPPKGATP